MNFTRDESHKGYKLCCDIFLTLCVFLIALHCALPLIDEDEDNVIEDTEFTTPLEKSDHICIEMTYIWSQLEDAVEHPKYNYWKGDYGRIKEELGNIDWDNELNTNGIDEAWTYFHSVVSSLVQKFVPLRDPAKMKSRQKKEWITTATRKDMRKDRLWNRYRNFASERNYKAYKVVRNRVIKFTREDKTNRGR